MSVFVQEAIASWCNAVVRYGRCQSTSEDLGHLLTKLRRKKGGINITAPHKTGAFVMASQVSPRSQTSGAVNTSKFSGQAFSDNTDSSGLAADIWGWGRDFANQTIFLFGSGGTIRSTALGLLSGCPQHICLVARNFRRITTVASELGQQTRGVRTQTSCHRWNAQPDLVPNLTINTTPANPLDLSPKSGEVAYDVRYFPALTDFLVGAQKEGSEVHNGSGMLVRQASESFRVWNTTRLKGDATLGISQAIDLHHS